MMYATSVNKYAAGDDIVVRNNIIEEPNFSGQLGGGGF